MAQPGMMMHAAFYPLVDNRGQPFDVVQLAWTRDEVIRFAGGHTALAVSGGPGIVMPIQPVVADGKAAQAFYIDLTQILAAQLGQHSISMLSKPVALVDPFR